MSDNLRMAVRERDPTEMDFGTFLATEGGRKCPRCGRYARYEDLGNLSFRFARGEGRQRIAGTVTMYGHKPGTGCNKTEPQ